MKTRSRIATLAAVGCVAVMLVNTGGGAAHADPLPTTSQVEAAAQDLFDYRNAILSGQPTTGLGVLATGGSISSVSANTATRNSEVAIASYLAGIRSTMWTNDGFEFTSYNTEITVGTIQYSGAVVTANFEEESTFESGSGATFMESTQQVGRILTFQPGNSWTIIGVANANPEATDVPANDISPYFAGDIGDPLPYEEAGEQDPLDVATNPTAIVNYALAHALQGTWNPTYHWFGNDCQNFASQSLYAGGWLSTYYGYYDDPHEWYYYFPAPDWTNTWVNTVWWRGFAIWSGRAPLVGGSVRNRVLGDMIQADWNRTSTDKISHIYIVTAKAGGEIYVSAHTTNRKNWPWANVIAAEPRATFYGHDVK